LVCSFHGISVRTRAKGFRRLLPRHGPPIAPHAMRLGFSMTAAADSGPVVVGTLRGCLTRVSPGFPGANPLVILGAQHAVQPRQRTLRKRRSVPAVAARPVHPETEVPR